MSLPTLYQNDVFMRDPFDSFAVDPFGIFSEFFTKPKVKSIVGYPELKITENESDIVATLAVPGLKKQDIDVSVKDRTITITHEHSKKDDNTSYCEAFTVSRIIPKNIDTEGITGSVKDGILKIVFPKNKSTISETKKIELK